MLKQLMLRNIALVDELCLSFERGLNVLTGETGAGKSIIIDAVSFLLGGRADKDMIRGGAAKAYVEGVFDVENNQGALSFLAEQSMEPEEGLLLLSRELNQAGRSVSRIGGIAVSLAQLKELSSKLLDIHGQHDHQSLLDERSHLRFLDDFGDEAHHLLQTALQERYDEYAALDKELRGSVALNARREERLAYLRLQERDIAQAKVELGEEDRLKNSLEQMRHAAKITRSLETAYGDVFDSGHDAQAALALLRDARRAMDDITAFGDNYKNIRDRLDSLYYEAEDIGLELRSMLDSFDADEAASQRIAERLDLIKRLSRKYNMTSDVFPEVLEAIQKEITEFEHLDENIGQLETRRDKAFTSYTLAAQALSASRKRLAESLSKRMENQLNALNMAGTRFEIAFEHEVGRPTHHGMDSVRMLLAPNKGEEAKPLSKIASGGETSRLMLALKSISAEHNLIPAMIFDEIDTGISGRTAQVVAEKLWDIAQYRQVLCVTHLQQIAAMASTHYLVEKSEVEGRTRTDVRMIDSSERIKEISRIISGFGEDSQSSLAHAQHMLKAAEDYRKISSH